MVVDRINSERVVLLGWSRAILMQLAHPLVAAGVLQHSTFKGGVVEAAARLHHTVSAMLSLTFADDARRAATLTHIRAIHRRVHGSLAAPAGPFPAGTPYSAEDPALLLWVHATLVDSTAEIYSRVVAPLTRHELDAMCNESAPLVEELGGDPATTPRTWKALRAYVTETLHSPVLAVTPDARALGLAVISPRVVGIAAPFSSLHALITAGLLPASIREAYGFTWNAGRERRFQRALRVLRATRRYAPRSVAQWKDARVLARERRLHATA
jgi:uncharacterized protein (DUF2236 family)